jgi:DNA-binding XRE family transcriptional regulator
VASVRRVSDPYSSAWPAGDISADCHGVRSSTKFCANVRRARERRGWTQEQLAAVSGVSLRRVQGIEAGRGNVTLDTLDALAGALGVDPTMLLRRPRGR